MLSNQLLNLTSALDSLNQSQDFKPDLMENIISSLEECTQRAEVLEDRLLEYGLDHEAKLPDEADNVLSFAAHKFKKDYNDYQQEEEA
ncbi:MAG: hypothetical protein OXR68_03930 [Alphaproteobacteria bacterium]|nr:hypothetical protein [Alphaproteobacteria bacterium]MDD9919755.1 hypothetical protein [Alphaproteobacteria bacterium]